MIVPYLMEVIKPMSDSLTAVLLLVVSTASMAWNPELGLIASGFSILLLAKIAPAY